MQEARHQPLPERGPSSPRPFRLIEVESWPQCREVIVEGRVDPEAAGELGECIGRLEESGHEYVLIDLDRCESIDVDTVKRLVVLREVLSVQQRELLVLGAHDEVRAKLRRIGSIECAEDGPALSRP